MKTVKKNLIPIFSVLLLFSNICGHGQELVGKIYQVKVPILVRNVYSSERLKDTNWKEPARYCEAKKGYIFQVIDVIENRVLIRWWEFTNSSKTRQEEQSNLTGEHGYELISFRNTHLDYEISLPDLNSKCTPYYGNDNSFTWGAITIPIKLRFGNKSERYFSFQESLNIGVAAGWSWQKEGTHQRSRNILLSVGISNVALDSLDFKNSNSKSDKPNVKSTSAVTFAVGYVFQFENFQLGAFTGMDILPYGIGRQWLHSGRPWIGFGLGMSLFSRNQASGGKGKNEDKP